MPESRTNIFNREQICHELTEVAKEFSVDFEDDEAKSVESFVDSIIGSRAIKTDSIVNIEVAPVQNFHNSAGNSLWIFGYGSLVWKADFPFISRHTGFIRGFERRFYQNSIDHRGTLTNPGRVVTLVPSVDTNSKVWGIAYQIAEANRDEVIKHLDFREKNGYQRYSVTFYPYSKEHAEESIDENCEIIMYIATEGNESFAGHINDLDRIADQIYSAVGPSGTNREYVYKLANAMRQLFPGKHDDHLFALERKLRDREERELKICTKTKEVLTTKLLEAFSSKMTKQQICSLIREELEIYENFVGSSNCLAQ